MDPQMRVHFFYFLEEIIAQTGVQFNKKIPENGIIAIVKRVPFI